MSAREWRRKRQAVAVGRAIVARAGLALATANARYWTTTAPLVRAELRRWKARARAIADPAVRELALRRLREVGFNAEVAATLATLAPGRRRADVVRALVALEVIFDFLDGVTELPARDPLADGRRLSQALVDAVEPLGRRDTDYFSGTGHDDDGYLSELVWTVRHGLRALPALRAVREPMRRAAARSAEAQVRAHAAGTLGRGQVEHWARGEAAPLGLPWREYLAGAASSVVSVHALIAAAADPRTRPEEAEQIDRVYFSICALATMLDSLVDYEADHRAGILALGYMRYYPDAGSLAVELADTARRAAREASRTRHPGHHLMTLVGVVAYYTTEPGARGAFARPTVEAIHRELRPLIWPTLAVMRSWRRVKALAVARRRGRAPSGTGAGAAPAAAPESQASSRPPRVGA